MTERPLRTDAHRRLEVFLGDWRATGVAHVGPGGEPGETPWSSTHTGRWHTGGFFLIQDERARLGGQDFDTLSLLGVDPSTGGYVVRTFDNGGFYRQYELTADGNRWTITGDTERAEITFSEHNRRQTIHWAWKPAGTWVPLCDRVAERHD
ncbi:DUF1579 family protein [Amycolatopsis albispora]|uniref:DUF1579 domain-containing protein n=1 Tax=Amycolatopsis albispora TaxID=1804986 RepID=A0A344L790_9PSEU|nr:DUF1579 family protein [Amycolatopsis albispora]AXB43914.1 hypothetical protein A4R43_16430 [Amycolatopsis albispora]